jgi:hypothetical protein
MKLLTIEHIAGSRSARFVLWAGVTVLALNAAWLVYTGLRPLKVRAAAPLTYTVLRTEQGFDQAGTLKYTNHYVEAVRSDGSKMWRGTTSEAQSRQIYFGNGDFVRTNDLQGRKSTYPKKYAGAPVPGDPKSHCGTAQESDPRWVNGGEEMIGGLRAARRTMHLGGSRTLTMWYGLDVGCAVVQQRFEHETGVTEQKLAALVPGEPDAALFQLSTVLKEVPPSELSDCSGKGSSCTPLPEQFKERMDKDYNAIRAKAADGSH